ncbi:putative peptidase [Talaromyces proteolyticus]|uniref:Peptidase n=1 Tax=Talaromyces proteolyticus TaxID=1131652 RepID=A0AAD4PXA5_9EURO|nr:putative peptidase [Talaromyces proteolyticus]KAH8692384.1 putative peptidase [Talaromyces proteolyticus]
MSKAKLLAALENNTDEHISLLQELIRAPSPNPPGDTRAAADILLKFLQKKGIAANIAASIPTAPNIVSEFTGQRSRNTGEARRLILNGHIDVFPAGDESGWTRNPWSGDLDDSGSIYGRGGVDMKAGTAALIIAYTYLFAHRHLLRGNVILSAVSDEETGGRHGSKWLIDNDPDYWRGTCVLNPEPTSLKTIRFGEKGTLRLTFTVRTLGAHGAYLHQTKGAIRTAMPLIQDLISTVESLRPNLPSSLASYLSRTDVRAAIDEACGQGAADIILIPTVNIGTIRGGVKVNMIPTDCVFETDIRLPIGLPSPTVIDKINEVLTRHPHATLAVQEAASNPSNYCAHDHEMVRILAKNAKAVAGVDDEPVATLSLGATDGKFWRYMGVPVYEYGVSPKGMGAPDEKVKVEEFLAVLRTLLLSAWDYLGGEE